MIEDVEGPRSPNRQGADQLTIEQIRAGYQGPGVRIAIIHDVAVQCAKSRGAANVETGAPAKNETLTPRLVVWNL